MATTSNRSFAARAQTIPLRLTEEERSMLRVLEGALSVSEYTDKVDVFSYRSNKVGRIQQQLGDMFAVLSGLTMAASSKQGRALVASDFAENGDFFAEVFEVGRRYKIMNPDMLRSTYGKLMYMLQDAQQPQLREALGFSCVGLDHTIIC